MKKSKKIISLFVTLALSAATCLSAASFFSGYAGGKLNYSANQESAEYDPELKLQAFFAGQFNFTENVWSRTEFSIDTKDLLSESLFHETESIFQVDEISLTVRNALTSNDNYFSLFMGTYDPIGSDIFLQRYFTINPIASKITESYLGLAGSILYPHFGVGIADIVRFHSTPTAFGGYLYVNHEDSKYYVFNADLRTAGAFRYFTYDLAAGIGIPLADKHNGEDVIIAIEKLYWHAGTTLLIGNNYTNALFIQAGVNNASFDAGTSSAIIPLSSIYVLIEPRFYIDNSHLNVSLYYIPEATADKLLFVEDSLGVDFNLYSDNMMIGNKTFTLGSHLSFSLIDKDLSSFKDFENILSNGYNINFTPYISTQLLSGELHAQANFKIMSFVQEEIAKGISFDIGYRTRF